MESMLNLLIVLVMSCASNPGTSCIPKSPASLAVNAQLTTVDIVVQDFSMNNFPGSDRWHHPLDSALERCMTMGDRLNYEGLECCVEYTHLWEEEIDRLYRLLLTESNTDFEEDRILATAQKNWLKFKDAEFAYIEMQYHDDDGSMYQVIRAWEEYAVVRQRGMMLYAHWVGLSGDR